MFWGLILKSNKKYTQTIEKPFHLSKASLDHSSSDDNPVQVMYTHEENSYLLCTLQKGKELQCSLDLNFDGEKVCFSTKGNGIVHLTGFLMQDEADFMDDMDGLDSDEEGSEEEEAEMDKKLAKLNKKIQESKGQKKQPAKASEEDDEEDSDEEEDESDEDAENGADVDESMEAGDSDEEDEDDDDEEDDDEEDDSEEEAEEPPKKQQKTENGVAQNGKNGHKKEKAQNGEKKPEGKQKEKQKEEQGKVIKMQGGLMAQELKVGNGAEAKPGRKVQVFYEGRLKSNNKVFDSAKTGKGFKFSLGKGEVIKGWDLGISGMKVGGKRRLVIPPGLGYGAKGHPPVIPQNSTLVFDVELKNVF